MLDSTIFKDFDRAKRASQRAIAEQINLIVLIEAFYLVKKINSKKRAIATHPLSVISC